MTSAARPELHVTGLGVTAAVGQGKRAFAEALWRGADAFAVLRRPGRQSGHSRFVGAELPALKVPAAAARVLRGATLSGEAVVATVQEAWDEARLADVDPARIGLVIGGSNLQQREQLLVQERYRERPEHVRPTFALSFMDTDLCGLCTEAFGIRGLAWTAGGASASGNVAVLQAVQALRSGEVDACIAVGALMDLSHLELQALRALGAMGSDRFAEEPAAACRPFDADRDGFIYGEACAALVIEREGAAARRGVAPYAALTGWSIALDGNRNPNPSLEGEVKVIREALARAGRAPSQIDYVNPHGSGSTVGDEVELRALRACGLDGAAINATKSITGHGLSAAGAVELVATLLQMERSRLHPTRNLVAPIDPSFDWIRGAAVERPVEAALSLSFGFGGVNTAICLERRGPRAPREEA